MVQLAGAAGGDEPDDRLSPEWMFQHSGVDHRGLDTAIAAQRVEHAQAVIERCQFGEGG